MDGREKRGRDGERKIKRERCERDTGTGCLLHVP